MGYHEAMLRLLGKRNAETKAHHLLPHLKPGFRVLDLGCGPGTISVGLANAVDPGQLHGVDIEESQVRLATQTARALGCQNATFHRADVLDLPFKDGYFDAAFCNSVLMHVPDTRRALSEVNRVLKPNGVFACREMVASSTFISPRFENGRTIWGTFADMIRVKGGHPDMGRDLKAAFVEAGFTNIRATVVFDSHGTDGEVEELYDMLGGWFFSEETMSEATSSGMATPDDFDDWQLALERWRSHPGAFGATASGEAIGWKP